MKVGNICGSINNTPGENLANAVFAQPLPNGARCPIGIPPQKTGEALEIMKEALEPTEWEVLRYGFGLNRSRVAQKDIAETMGLTPNAVSDIMANGVAKLQQQRFKMRLRALVPSNDSLYVAMENKKAVDKAEKEVAGYKNGIRERDAEIERLKSQLADQQEQTDALRKQLSEARAATGQSTSRVMQLMAELDTLKGEVANLRDEKTQMANTFQTLQRVFESVGAVSQQMAEEELERQQSALASVSDELRLEKVFYGDILMLLHRIGIQELSALCKCSERNLTSLKVPKKFVDTIQRKLKELGLSLRVEA